MKGREGKFGQHGSPTSRFSLDITRQVGFPCKLTFSLSCTDSQHNIFHIFSIESQEAPYLNEKPCLAPVLPSSEPVPEV